MLYLKLPLISPGLVHLRKGLRRAYKQWDLSERAYNGKGKRFKTSYSSADQNTFCINWFLIRVENVIINRIQRGACIPWGL